MKGIVKAIIAGCIFIAIGVAVLLIALGLNGWSFTPEYDMATYSTENAEITEVIDTIKLNFKAGKVRTEFYDEDYITVKYPKIKNFDTDIEVKDGTFSFTGPNKQHWYSFPLGWGNLPETVIKLPKNTTYNLDLTVNAGTMTIEKGDYGTVKLQLNAGSFKVNGASSCTEFDCTVNAGAATIENMNCSGLFDCNVNAGSINIMSITCDNIKTEVNAGSLKVEVNGKQADYTIFVEKSAGSCNVEEQSGTGNKTLTIDVSAGSVDVTFTG